ncbi:MAG: DNA translocase FtsK, partial [Pontibacter sp.]|nr:DNA translocase FtsK [Pontibacter sp.]
GYVVFAFDAIGRYGYLGGGIGVEAAIWMNSLIGWGSWLVLGFLMLVFLVGFFNITSINWGSKAKEEESEEDKPLGNYAAAQSLGDVLGNGGRSVNHTADPTASLEYEEEEMEDELYDEDDDEINRALEMELSALTTINEVPTKPAGPTLELDIDEALLQEEEFDNTEEPELEPEMELEIEQIPEEAEADVISGENYDPTLDLARYQYPHIDLLNDYGTNKIQVTKEELEENKDKIVATLGHYNIGIASIKATIGPTVTLYEIVPDAGVRISKIKNLEDDIALSLAALGIRIIAPIPGKGTIGIEVPNTKKEMVSIKSILSTEKFMKSDMDLPIAFGKTITNEVFITDLAKMPHLLMAGATG